jgi:hypothetical protein
MRAHTLLWTLQSLRKLFPEEPIMLLYRPTATSNWADRCIMYDKKYSPFKQYNHRSILNNEIVIEFDHDDKEVNKKATLEVLKRLREDDIAYSYWDSGNKSFHVHCLVGIDEGINKKYFKKAFLQAYTEGLEVKPDYAVCNNNHLIRAENGLHEKTGRHKALIRNTEGYPRVSDVPRRVRDYYDNLCNRARRSNKASSVDISSHDGVRWILDNGVRDGRTRAIFILTQALRNKYTEEELVTLIQDWYAKTGGSMSRSRVAYEVKRQLKGEAYTITPAYVDAFLEEIGVKVDA